MIPPQLGILVLQGINNLMTFLNLRSQSFSKSILASHVFVLLLYIAIGLFKIVDLAISIFQLLLCHVLIEIFD